jgi:hypothetical protein
MNKRRRFTQSESLTDRLATFAKLMRERAATMVLRLPQKFCTRERQSGGQDCRHESMD